MPVRAFLDSDPAIVILRGAVMHVSMPVRAFLDSDPSWRADNVCRLIPFQCPSGHFLIQTKSAFTCRVCHGVLFQCPSGHFLIQTHTQYDRACSCNWVSMPVRAFLDSDKHPVFISPPQANKFQCPSGHFLIQTLIFSISGNLRLSGFNARQGIS